MKSPERVGSRETQYSTLGLMCLITAPIWSKVRQIFSCAPALQSSTAVVPKLVVRDYARWWSRNDGCSITAVIAVPLWSRCFTTSWGQPSGGLCVCGGFAVPSGDLPISKQQLFPSWSYFWFSIKNQMWLPIGDTLFTASGRPTEGAWAPPPFRRLESPPPPGKWKSPL